MVRHLIVANQTLGGEVLDREVQQRAEHGGAHFYVLVPMIEPARETSQWGPGDPMFGVGRASASVSADAVAVAHRRSRHRLDSMLSRIRALGGQATGEIGDPDPARAVQGVLERHTFDVVIVSTLPAGISKWLRMDLPSRVDRLVDCPVITVEAEAGAL